MTPVGPLMSFDHSYPSLLQSLGMAHITSSPQRSSSPISRSESADNMTRSGAESSKSAKRKGTRSVSTLTPSQLARKRANDREAQRAIRARTKEHIENLEREVEELRSLTNRDETVQDLIKRNKALEEELHRLRESIGIPTSGPRGVYRPPYHSPSSRASSLGHGSSEYPAVQDVAGYDGMSGSGEPWPSAVRCSVPSTVSSPSSSGADDFGNTYFPTSAPTSMMDRSGMNSPTVSSLSGKMGYDDLKSANSMESIPNVLSSFTNSVSSSNNNNHQSNGNLYWGAPVLMTSPLCQNDALLLNYVQDCRRLVNLAGRKPPFEAVFGPACPNIRPLLEAQWNFVTAVLHEQFSSFPPSPPPHPLVDLATTIFDNDNMVLVLERIGNFVLFQRLVAWLIHPTQETHSGLGVGLAPRPSQGSVPHCQWIDLVLWGQLRDVIIQRQELYATDEFRHLYSTSLRIINWHGGLPHALFFDRSTGAVYLSDAFVAHVLDTGNWVLQDEFFRRYPELGGLVAMGRQGS